MSDRYSVESVDAVDARRLLKRNVINRPLNSAVVDAYADRMSGGEWPFRSYCPIIFAESTGFLFDGQHRLWAVVRSETVQDFVIVWDFPMGLRERRALWFEVRRWARRL